MLTNTTLTNWLKRTGGDRYGRPAREAQSGSWPCLAEPAAKRLTLGGRTVAASLQVRLRSVAATDPAISVGDAVDVLGQSWEVLAADRTVHGVLGHLTLLLGPLPA